MSELIHTLVWENGGPTIKCVGEIIRCKDCKHWQPQSNGVVEEPYCKRLGFKEETGLDLRIGSDDDYCSFGERRTDETN